MLTAVNVIHSLVYGRHLEGPTGKGMISPAFYNRYQNRFSIPAAPEQLAHCGVRLAVVEWDSHARLQVSVDRIQSYSTH